MGYFRRRVDRGRARQRARELHEQSLDARPWEAIPAEPPKGQSFLRFAALDQHPGSLRRRGIFSAAYKLRNAGQLDAASEERLGVLLEWFGNHLHAPSLDEERAVFLFKSSAAACMRHIWDLAHLLRDAGVWIEMQVVDKPGRVVFEDELQVAVVPWVEEREL